MGDSVNWRIGEFLIVLLLVFSMPVFAKEVPVKEEKKVDCLSCHAYKNMVRFDKGGDVKSLYIDKEAFLETGHGKAVCTECHEGFEELPHNKDLEKVTCVKDCHIVDSLEEKTFSHKEKADILSQSAHSKVNAAGEDKENAELIPDCKGCHKFNYPHRKDVPEDQRLHHVMSKEDAVKVCAGCHANKDVQEKFGLHGVVASYNETFHGKAHRFGMKEAPGCIDCHADPSRGVHKIAKKDSPSSIIGKESRHKTCTQKACHVDGTVKMGGWHPHAMHDKEKYPLEYYMLSFFRFLTAGVMYLFLSIMFLELLRRLFPNFTLIKRGEK